MLGVLLILQVVALVGIGVHLFSSIDWDRIVALANEQAQTLPKPLEQRLEEAILFVIFFLPPTVLLLLVASGSYFFGAGGGCYLGCAGRDPASLPVLLPEPRPWFTYPIIAYCILMV